jgi:hypothetical protein
MNAIRDGHGLGWPPLACSRASIAASRYGREIVKKLVKGLSAFDVIQERLKRNPRPAKNGRAAKNLWIARGDTI